MYLKESNCTSKCVNLFTNVIQYIKKTKKEQSVAKSVAKLNIKHNQTNQTFVDVDVIM